MTVGAALALIVALLLIFLAAWWATSVERPW